MFLVINLIHKSVIVDIESKLPLNKSWSLYLSLLCVRVNKFIDSNSSLVYPKSLIQPSLIFKKSPLEAIVAVKSVAVLNKKESSFSVLRRLFFNGVSFSKKALMSLVNVKDKMFLLIISLGL